MFSALTRYLTYYILKMNVSLSLHRTLLTNWFWSDCVVSWQRCQTTCSVNSSTRRHVCSRSRFCPAAPTGLHKLSSGFFVLVFLSTSCQISKGLTAKRFNYCQNNSGREFVTDQSAEIWLTAAWTQSLIVLLIIIILLFSFQGFYPSVSFTFIVAAWSNMFSPPEGETTDPLLKK